MHKNTTPKPLKVADLYPVRDSRISFFAYQQAVNDFKRGLPLATVHKVNMNGDSFTVLARSYSQAQAKVAARRAITL